MQQAQNSTPLVLLPTPDSSTRITLVPATTIARWVTNPMSRSAGDKDKPVELKRAPGEYYPEANWCVFVSVLSLILLRRIGKNAVQPTRLDRAVKKLQVNVDVMRRFMFSKVRCWRVCDLTREAGKGHQETH